MRKGILFGLLFGLMLACQAQVREEWRYVYMPSDPDLLARLERMVRLQDGSWLLLGWTETPLSGQDALAIRLQPNGIPEWIYQRDGAGFDDAFVDALEVSTWQGDAFYLLGRFTDSDGYLQTRLLRLTPSGQLLGETLLPAEPTTHNRPLRVAWMESSEVGVFTEQVSGASSQLAYYIGATYLYNFRPWMVLVGEHAPEQPTPVLVMGTFSTPLRGLDVRMVNFLFGNQRDYSGPAGGFDVPGVGAGRLLYDPAQSGYWVAVQSEGSYTGEDIVLLRLDVGLRLLWGYRYTTAQHDDFPESLTLDAQGITYLLARTHLWSGEPFEQRVLRLLRFSPNGALQQNSLIEVGRLPQDSSPLTGIVRLNPAGQLFVTAYNPPYLARLGANGQPLWVRTPNILFRELFVERDGSLVIAGQGLIHNEENFPRLTVVKYAPDGDVDGDGCVDDADLLRVLMAFGQSGSDLLEDMNGDGIVDDADLIHVLFLFGSGC